MKPREKITIIFPEGVVLTQVNEARGDDGWYAAMPENIASFRLRDDDEGARWLRGHHMPDSQQVDAARVALALGKPEPRQPRRSTTRASNQIIGNALGAFAAEMVHKFITGEKS